MNIKEGIKRLTWVLGCILGIVFIATFNWYDESIWEIILGIHLFMCLGVGIAWAVYGISLFVIRGFQKKEKDRED